MESGIHSTGYIMEAALASPKVLTRHDPFGDGGNVRSSIDVDACSQHRAARCLSALTTCTYTLTLLLPAAACVPLGFAGYSRRAAAALRSRIDHLEANSRLTDLVLEGESPSLTTLTGHSILY